MQGTRTLFCSCSPAVEENQWEDVMLNKTSRHTCSDMHSTICKVHRNYGVCTEIIIKIKSTHSRLGPHTSVREKPQGTLKKEKDKAHRWYQIYIKEWIYYWLNYSHWIRQPLPWAMFLCRVLKWIKQSSNPPHTHKPFNSNCAICCLRRCFIIQHRSHG